MTGREIKEKRFDKAAMFGYKAEEVELYLAEVAQAVDQLNKEKAILEKKLEILAAKIEEYRKDEDSMKEALLGAQRLGNTVVAEANEKAGHILNEAEGKATAMLREAEERATAMLQEADQNAAKAVSGVKVQVEKEQQTLLRMQKEVSNFKARLLSLYKSHLDLITALPELEEEESTPEPEQEIAETPEAEAEPEAIEQPEPQAEEEPEVAEPEAAEPEEEEEEAPEEEELDPVERAKRELENTQQIAKKQMNVVNNVELEKTQQISFSNSSQRIPFKSERVDMEKSFESKFGELKFGKNNK